MEMNRRNTKKDFYSYKADLQKIPEFEHNELINDWLIEHVCRFNETAGYLLRSLQKVSAYGKLLSEEKRFVVQDPPFRKRISPFLKEPCCDNPNMTDLRGAATSSNAECSRWL